jgi:Trk-type K+ transport system membrane component
MYAIATFFVVGVISVAFTKLAAGALIATGVPPESAMFQARSAFSGAGFTTNEAENVVNHRVRRRIIGTTMFVGSLGTPTLVLTVLVGFIAPGPGSTTERALVTISGVLLILIAVLNRPVQRRLERVGHRYVHRRLIPALSSNRLDLLTLSDEFAVQAVKLEATPEESVRSLRGLATAFPDVTILGVRRGKTYFGAPPVDIRLLAGDELVIYAHREHELVS